MTDRRPPKDAAQDTASEPTDEGTSDGKRSQTVAAGRAAPRSTFAGAEPAQPRQAGRPESGPLQAPRSVFQPGAAPNDPAPALRGGASSDPDKTVKRAYPNGWGATLLVGNAVPPPDGARPVTDTEKTVVSEFPPAAQSAAEPLREPSNRPAPAPYQQARSAKSGTLLMPSANADDLAAFAPKAAERSNRPNPPSSTPQRAQAAVPPATPAPAPRAATTSAAAPQSKSTSGAPVHRTEPLHLSLDARDMVPKATASMRPGAARNRAPMMILTAGIVVLLVIVALAWFNHRAPVAAGVEAPVDGVRSSAVPATPLAATPTPAAQLPVAAPTAVVPTSAPVQPTMPSTPVAPKPVATTEPAAHTAPADKPAASVTKPVQHSAPAKAHASASKPASANNESINDAREALKALESPPVVRVKRKADSDERAPSDEGAAPSPPPLPDPEGE